MNDMSSEEQSRTTAAAPLYITIGPPCAGKTTWLSMQQNQQGVSDNHPSMMTTRSNIVDVSLDDQEGVYIPLPCQQFLQTAGTGTSTGTSTGSNDEILTQTRIFGKTLEERIHNNPDQFELRCILGRLSGKLTCEQFQTAIATALRTANNAQNQNSQEIIAETLVNVVEEEIMSAADSGSNDQSTATTTTLLPETVDLFVREAIYRPTLANNNTTALERAENLLWNVSTNTKMAWGNTNTKPSDYKLALQVAEKQQRPVHFVIYHDNDTISTLPKRRYDNDEDPEEEGEGHLLFEDNVFDLSATDFRDLIQRSIRRLIQTGRYVPSTVIWDMRQRTAESIHRVVDAWRNKAAKNDNNNTAETSTTISKFEMDQLLANMINFDMLPNRTVVQQRPETSAVSNRPRYGFNGNYNTQQHRYYNNNYNESRRQDERRGRPWDTTARGNHRWDGRGGGRGGGGGGRYRGPPPRGAPGRAATSRGRGGYGSGYQKQANGNGGTYQNRQQQGSYQYRGSGNDIRRTWNASSSPGRGYQQYNTTRRFEDPNHRQRGEGRGGYQGDWRNQNRPG